MDEHEGKKKLAEYEAAQAERCGGIDYQPTKADLEIERIEAAMAPITAAHRVAAHLDEIARLLPCLSAEAKDGYLNGLSAFDDELMAEYVAMLRRKAESTRKAAPVDPATDEERQEVFEAYCDQMGDLRSKEHAEIAVDQFTEADWRYEADMLKAYALDNEE